MPDSGPESTREPRGLRPAGPGDRAPAGIRDDLQLARRCADGDAAAWEAFLSRFAPLLHGVIRRVLSRYRIADSATEEDAFAAVIEVLLRDDGRALRSFREPFNFAAWLSVLARRQCRAWIESRRFPGVSLDPQAVAGEGGPVVDDLVEREASVRREALGRAVHALIGELPPRDRLLVTLFYFDRRKYREIARILRMPVGNVGKTLARALEKLRERIERAGGGPDGPSIL
jgi:RNA polymerase sigma-70 factor (ECF subfamily)